MDINKTIADNIGLIRSQLKQYKLLYDPDAESIAYEALYTAIVTFDTAKNCKLSTYATCCIYNALGCYVRVLRRKRQLEVVSYNRMLYTEDGNEHEFLELLPCDDTADQRLMDQEFYEFLDAAIDYAYNKLKTDMQRKIIDLWRESEYTIPQKEVALKLGVSQPTVSQTYGMFKGTIKKKLEAYYNA